MRLPFDIDNQVFLAAVGTTQVLTSISAKRGPNARIEVQFYRSLGVVPQDLSAGATGVLTVKETNKFDANAVFQAASWVKTVDENGFPLWVFTLGLQNDTGNTLLGAEDPVTVTVTAATNVFAATAHGLVAGNVVQFSTSTTLPTPLLAGRDYFVIASGLTVDAFKVSLTLAGAEVDITDTGTGTHKFRKISDDVATVNLMAALQYVADGNTIESLNDLTFVYKNDIIRDADTGTVAAPQDVIVNVRAGKDSITNGTDTGTVVFDSPFGSASIAIALTVSTPAGGDKFFAIYTESSLSANGFDYFLDGNVPATGYKLNYIATEL